MSESVIDRTRENLAETARTASRLTSAVAEAIEEGIGVARRVVKQGGDAAEELFDDTTKRLQRHPTETLVASLAVGIAIGMVIGWVMKRS